MGNSIKGAVTQGAIESVDLGPDRLKPVTAITIEVIQTVKADKRLTCDLARRAVTHRRPDQRLPSRQYTNHVEREQGMAKVIQHTTKRSDVELEWIPFSRTLIAPS